MHTPCLSPGKTRRIFDSHPAHLLITKYANNHLFVQCSSDFKTNEKKIMKELDQLQSTAGRSSSKGGDLGGAMEGTEEIRQWVSSLDFRIFCKLGAMVDFGSFI